MPVPAIPPGAPVDSPVLDTALAKRGVDSRFLSRSAPTPANWLTAFNAIGLPFTPIVTYYPDRVAPYGSIGIGSSALFDLFSVARSAPTNTYYVSTAGSDSNAGTSAAPFATMAKARDTANTAGTPSKVIVLAGDYSAGFSATPGQGGVSPSVDICWVARGGIVRTGTWSVPTFAADGTYANIWSVALGNFDRICDRINLSPFGNYADLVPVSTAAICSRTPGSYAYVSGTLYVNRIDGLQPTGANTRVFRANQTTVGLSKQVNMAFLPETGGDSWEFEGGTQGVANLVVNLTPAGVKAVVFDSCSFKYGGGVTNAAVNGVYSAGVQGVIACFNCRADANWNDGFGGHNDVQSSAAKTAFITVNCSGFDNGRSPNQSCNGWTHHENVIALDVCGIYRGNHAGTVRSVGASLNWCVQTISKDDFGDLYAGGAISPTAFQFDATAQAWLDAVVPDMPANAIAINQQGSAVIQARNMPPSRARVVGTVGAY